MIVWIVRRKLVKERRQLYANLFKFEKRLDTYNLLLGAANFTLGPESHYTVLRNKLECMKAIAGIKEKILEVGNRLGSLDNKKWYSWRIK